MKKKICYIVTIGRTIKAFFTEQLRFLSQNGFDVTVICSDDCDLAKELPVEVHFINLQIPRGISVIGSVKALVKLKKILRENQFDMVQYSTPNAAFLASVAAKTERVPVRNYHLMGLRYESEQGIKRGILKTFEKRVCNNSTHIECVCESTKRKGIREGLFSEARAVVVGNGSTGGIDHRKYDISRKQTWRKELRAELKIDKSAVVFGFVGRIAVDKGIRELYQAWEALSRQHEAAVLLMVGPSEDAELLEKGKQINSVIFTGKVEDVERYFSAIDVLVLPSYREGFGNVLIEAETMGVPCIASDIEGPRDAMVHGETGLLFHCRDVGALTEAMETMLDENNRQAFSANAVEFSRLFDSRDLNKQILERKLALINGKGL